MTGGHLWGGVPATYAVQVGNPRCIAVECAGSPSMVLARTKSSAAYHTISTGVGGQTPIVEQNAVRGTGDGILRTQRALAFHTILLTGLSFKLGLINVRLRHPSPTEKKMCSLSPSAWYFTRGLRRLTVPSPPCIAS